MNFKNLLKAVLIFVFFLFQGSLSLFAQINWTKDADNPILKRDTVVANLPNDIYAISDCWVEKEGTVYKMWYTCGGINYPSDTLLRARLCYCESPDGIHWTKYSGNPVLDVSYSGGWDSLGVETATIVIDSSAPSAEKYKMWYAGQYFNSYRYDIGYAYSSDGKNWTKHASPVLQVGTATQWDNGFLEGPSVIKDGSIYKMWYCGYDALVDGNDTDGKANIGYATSPDGINWTKYSGNPVLQTGTDAWDSIYVQDPHVIKLGGIYHMWYGGNNTDGYGQQVGYATSEDGINWTKSFANPVLQRGNAGAWDANTASFPAVLFESGIFKMWYTGKDVDPPPTNSTDYYWEIGYASAPATGMADFSYKDDNVITLYPNPFNTLATVKADKIFKDASLTVYNSLGQQVKQINNISGQIIILQRDNLPSGLYFIRLKQENKTFITDKFVITNN